MSRSSMSEVRPWGLRMTGIGVEPSCAGGSDNWYCRSSPSNIILRRSLVVASRSRPSHDGSATAPRLGRGGSGPLLPLEHDAVTSATSTATSTATPFGFTCPISRGVVGRRAEAQVRRRGPSRQPEPRLQSIGRRRLESARTQLRPPMRPHLRSSAPIPAPGTGDRRARTPNRLRSPPRVRPTAGSIHRGHEPSTWGTGGRWPMS